MNTRNLTIKTITGVFNIRQNFFIKRMIRNELIRYKGAVNNFDLFNCALKITFKNTRGSGEVSDKYRGIHPSYIGCIGLVTSSASDPGMSGSISPFASITPNGIFVVKEEAKEFNIEGIETISEDELEEIEVTED
jgi:hypothetical protein